MLTGKQLEDIYTDIQGTLHSIKKDYQINVIGINKELKVKFKLFQETYPKIFRKIINESMAESFIKNLVNLYNNQLSKNKSNIIYKNFPKVYKTIKDGGLLMFLKDIRFIQNEFVNLKNKYNKEYQSAKEEAKNRFKTKYKDFSETYSTLFVGIINETLEHNTMVAMIKSYKKYQSQQLSEHDASVEFGQHLVDTIIKPNLPPPK